MKNEWQAALDRFLEGAITFTELVANLIAIQIRVEHEHFERTGERPAHPVKVEIVRG